MAKLDTKQLIDVLIYVVFAGVLLPIIASQVVTMQADPNLSAWTLLLGVITVFIILGVVYGIVKTIL